LSLYLVAAAGGNRGLGLFYFLAAFPVLSFVLGFRRGLVFIASFSLGVLGRVFWFPLPVHSVFADPGLQVGLLVVFGASAVLGTITAVYQHSLIEFLAKLAYEDAVTGLSTRNRIVEHLELSVKAPQPFFLLGLKLFGFDEV